MNKFIVSACVRVCWRLFTHTPDSRLLARQHAHKHARMHAACTRLATCRHRHTHICKHSARGRGTEHLAKRAGNDWRIRSMQACCMSLPSRPSARARLARCAHEPVLVRWSLRVRGAARRRAGHAVVCNNTKGRRRGGPRGRGEAQARSLVLSFESVARAPSLSVHPPSRSRNPLVAPLGGLSFAPAAAATEDCGTNSILLIFCSVPG